MSKEVNPRAVFDRLFGPAEATAEDRAARRTTRTPSQEHSGLRGRGRRRVASQTRPERRPQARRVSVRRARDRAPSAEGRSGSGFGTRGRATRRHAQGVRRTRAPDDGHDRAGLSDRFHADCHLHVPERRKQPQLSRDRRAGRPSRVVAPRPRSAEAGADQQDQPLSPRPAGRISAEARLRSRKATAPCCRAR